MERYCQSDSTVAYGFQRDKDRDSDVERFVGSQNHFETHIGWIRMPNKMAIKLFRNSKFLVFLGVRFETYHWPCFLNSDWLKCLPDSFISKGHHSQLELRL